MSKEISYVMGRKNKTYLDQFQISICIPNRLVLEKLMKTEMPFIVTGKEDPVWKHEHFRETDFSIEVQRLLRHSWDDLIKKLKELDEEKGNMVDVIILSIISSGPHIIPVFQISYYYNDNEDYENYVFNSYIETQQVEEYYCGWTGEPAYLPTKELLIEFNLNLEKKYRRKCIFKNIQHLDYRT